MRWPASGACVHRGAGLLGIDRHGRDAGGFSGSATDRDSFQPGGDALLAGALAADDGLHFGLPGDGVADAAVDFDGKVESTRIPPDARVWRGSAGAGDRAAANVAGGGSGNRDPAGVLHVRRCDVPGSGGVDGHGGNQHVAGGGSSDKARVRDVDAAGSVTRAKPGGGSGERTFAAVWAAAASAGNYRCWKRRRTSSRVTAPSIEPRRARLVMGRRGQR